MLLNNPGRYRLFKSCWDHDRIIQIAALKYSHVLYKDSNAAHWEDMKVEVEKKREEERGSSQVVLTIMRAKWTSQTAVACTGSLFQYTPASSLYGPGTLEQ